MLTPNRISSLCSNTFDRFVLKVLLYTIKWKSSMPLDEEKTS